MPTSKVFIPGKVLLSGEHAVVYGKPALVASINLGVRVESFGLAQDESKVLSVKSKTNIHSLIVTKAIELGGGDLDKIGVKIESDLPIGSGLGSSAAVAAAVIKAVRLYFNKPIDRDELIKLTLECERIAHGNASGVDPAAVVYGGLLWYIKGESIERFRIGKPVRLGLINTGKPAETTKKMIEMVGLRFKIQELGIKKIIDQVGTVTGKMRGILERGEDMSGVINENGLLLEELGVVGDKAKTLSQELRAMGAGVKVTGAGGAKRGSGMLMVYHSDWSTLISFLNTKKLDYIDVTIGE